MRSPMKKFFIAVSIMLTFLNAAFAQRMYDGSGHQIGRADGLRRMQIIVYFYFFM